MSVSEAMSVLATNAVLSAPLVVGDIKGGTYQLLAFLSIGDLTRAFLSAVHARIPEDAPTTTLYTTVELAKIGEEFGARR